MTGHAEEIARGGRFGFGENWTRFLAMLDEDRIVSAEQSLKEMLGVADLAEKRFLDIGSGSGLLSLAARRLGATVQSFDYDPRSVACTAELRRRYFPDDPKWVVEEGSVLDRDYLSRLGTFDVVCSWGVLHHTGAMWEALENIIPSVADDGRLYIAIYNDQGRASTIWLRVKQAYNRLPASMRWLVLGPVFLRLWGPPMARDLVLGRPFDTWRHYGDRGRRGMSPWHDLVDWTGGLPFEVASPEEIFTFYRDRGFRLDRLKTCAGRHGCNEYVLTREK